MKVTSLIGANNTGSVPGFPPKLNMLHVREIKTELYDGTYFFYAVFAEPGETAGDVLVLSVRDKNTAIKADRYIQAQMMTGGSISLEVYRAKDEGIRKETDNG